MSEIVQKEKSITDSTFDKAASMIRELFDNSLALTEAANILKSGNISIELKKRFILSAIDEIWVKVIEDSLVALDDRIRNYGRFIEEREEVLPIELSRHITPRSLQHLSQNTNLIQKIEGDEITPSKILNVFREETTQTYENKFINTLINRLFIFVHKRYTVAKNQGLDEKSTKLRIDGTFEHDNIKGKINFDIEIAEKLDEETNSEFVKSTPLWERVERIYNIVDAYNSSEFVAMMGKSYIRPPVMRTNAILKNKYLKQCLALWEFIESYDDAGYGMLVQEDVESIDESYLQEIYSFLALQYAVFRHNIKNEFSPDNTLDSVMTDVPIAPKFISEVEEIEESEFNVFDTTYMKMLPITEASSRSRLSDSEREVMFAIDVILSAVPLWEERKKQEEEQRLAEEAERLEAATRLEAAARLEASIRLEEELAKQKIAEATKLADSLVSAAMESQLEVDKLTTKLTDEQTQDEQQNKEEKPDVEKRKQSRKYKKHMELKAKAAENARRNALEREKRIVAELEAQKFEQEEKERQKRRQQALLEAEKEAMEIFDADKSKHKRHSKRGHNKK